MNPLNAKEVRLINEAVENTDKPRQICEATKDWAEKVRQELADELDMDIDDVEIVRIEKNKVSIEGSGASNGESEWDVYKNEKDAYDDAVEQNSDMFESDPAVLEGAKWLKQFVYVSPTDIRIIASEEADNYVNDIKEEDDGERVCEEANMSRQYEKLKEKIEELEDLDLDGNLDKKGEKKLAKLQKDLEKLIDKAGDKVHDDYYDDLKKRLEKDPMEWAEELGYSDYTDVKWLNVDYEEASKYVVDTDGIAHTLDRYDGEELELKSGIAYGTN